MWTFMRASDTGEGPVKPCKAILHLTRRRKTLNAVQTFPDEKEFSVRSKHIARTGHHRICNRLDSDGHGCFRTHYRSIQCIPLDGFTSRFLYQPHQFLTAHTLWRGGACIVVDFFFNYGPVEVVRAKAQGDLRNLRRQHLPVGLDTREVIEHQAAYGNLFNVEHARGSRQMLQGRVVRMERQWNECLEATR